MEEEPPRWCCGVYGVGEAVEPDVIGVQFPDEVDELFDAAPEPVEFPDDDCVPVAGDFQCFG